MADNNENLSSGLLGIQLSDSKVEDAAVPSAAAEPDKKSKASRTAQSEEEFEAVKRSYRVKVENGEIWRTINLPLDPGAGAAVTKPEAQALLHAVEELYFFRRYGEGAAFVRRVLNGDGAAPGLDEDTRKMLRYYETRCVQRQREAEGEGGRRDGI